MKNRAPGEPAYVPCSTYRLQLNLRFTFRQAASVVAYLNDLGITDCYTSPFLMAHPGSMHGYDVTDHTRFNPEIGSEEEFTEFAERLKQRGMGLVVDVVPNHMCITHPSNLWWWDVLENGPSSDYSRHFDIDWNPPKSELANKVLLPFLPDQFGLVLESQSIQSGLRRRGFFPWTLGHSLSPGSAFLGAASGKSSAEGQRNNSRHRRPRAGTGEHTHGYFASAAAGGNRSGQE